MNTRPNQPNKTEPLPRRRRRGKPLTTLDVVVRLAAAASLGLIGITLALDADQIRALVGQKTDHAAPLSAGTTPTPFPFDNLPDGRIPIGRIDGSTPSTAGVKRAGTAHVWQLDDPGDESKVITANVSDSIDLPAVVQATATQAEAAKTRPQQSLPAGKSHVRKPLPKLSAGTSSPSQTVGASRPSPAPASSNLGAGRARVSRPTPVEDRRPQSGRAYVRNPLPTAASPAGRSRVVLAANDSPSAVGKTATNDAQQTKEFTLVLDESPTKSTTVAEQEATTIDQTPVRQRKPVQGRSTVPLKQHLQQLYAPVVTVDSTVTPSRATAIQTETAKPVSQPAVIDTPVVADTKLTPTWDLADSQPQTKVATFIPPTPTVEKKPQNLTPPRQVPPAAPKVDEHKPTQKTVGNKRLAGRFGFGTVLGKLFNKKPAGSTPPVTAVASLDIPNNNPQVQPLPTKQALERDIPKAETKGTTTANSNMKSQPETDVVATVADTALTPPAAKKPIAAAEKPKEPNLPLMDDEPVVASDPVLNLMSANEYSLPFPPLVVAQLDQPAAVPAPKENAPLLPEPGTAETPDTLGYAGFKPVGELTVDINVVKGDDPPDFAGPEFDEVKPVELNTEWIDQALAAPVFPFYHQPLYFEDPNAERCGKTWGILQPARSAAQFYLTIPILPYLIGALPPNKRVESLGDCEWGSKYRFRDAYLPPWSLKGAALEGAAATGLIFLIP